MTITEQEYLNSMGTPHQPSDPNEMIYDNMQEQKISNVIAQLNPDNLISDIEYRLRGYKKNNFTGEWEKLKGFKPVSEKLISQHISFLGAILNDNTRFSNYSAKEINNIMIQIIDFIRDDLTDNDEEYSLTSSSERKEMKVVQELIRKPNGEVILKDIELEVTTLIYYGSTNYNEMTRIGHIICINVFSVLKRALNGTESRRIFSSLRVNETLSQPNQKGFGEALQFWK